MKHNELITEWHAGIRINVLSHYECAKLFESYHRKLGYPTVILSALAGTTLVSLPNINNVWGQLLTLGLSISVTVFASLQTFLRYSERAEKHKSAATEFGKLRRELEQFIVFSTTDGAITRDEMEVIRLRWGELSAHAPAIPNRVYTRMYRKVWQRAGIEEMDIPPSPTGP